MLRDRHLRLRSIARRLKIRYVPGMSEEDLEWTIEETLRNEGIPANEKLISELRAMGIVFAIPLDAKHDVFSRIMETEGITVKMKTACGRALEKQIGKVLSQLKDRGKCTIYWAGGDIKIESHSGKGRKPFPKTPASDAIKQYWQNLKEKHGRVSHPKVIKGLRKLLREIGGTPPIFTADEVTDQMKALQYLQALQREAKAGNKKILKILGTKKGKKAKHTVGNSSVEVKL